jgi:hypothetical protein
MAHPQAKATPREMDACAALLTRRPNSLAYDSMDSFFPPVGEMTEQGWRYIRRGQLFLLAWFKAVGHVG